MQKAAWVVVKKHKPNSIDIYDIYKSKNDIFLQKDEKWRKVVISFYKPVHDK